MKPDFRIPDREQMEGYTLIFALALLDGMERRFLTEGIHYKFRKDRTVLAVHMPSTVKRLREQGLLVCDHAVFSKALHYKWEGVCPLVVAYDRPTSFGSRKNKRRAVHLSWKELQLLTRGGEDGTR